MSRYLVLALLAATVASVVKTTVEVRLAMNEMVDSICLFEDPAAGNYSCKDLSVHHPQGWIALSVGLLVVLLAVGVRRRRQRCVGQLAVV